MIKYLKAVAHKLRNGLRLLKKIYSESARSPARNQQHRVEILLRKLEDCTVFQEYQTEWWNGKWVNWIGDMHEHIKAIYNLALDINAQNIVEFGIGSGQSTLCLTAAAQKTNGMVISLDPREKHKTFVQNNVRYWGLSRNWNPQYGEDSFSVRDIYREVFKNKPIDLLFIDSGHTYSDTKAEIEYWEPLVKKGGAIIFHDIVWCFDSVQAAIDEFLNETQTAIIKPDFKHAQCEGCDSMDSRPTINLQGRPTIQSKEVFDKPKFAEDRTFFDYNFLEPSYDTEDLKNQYEYIYKMRLNCVGLGILYKYKDSAIAPKNFNTNEQSNWNLTPK